MFFSLMVIYKFSSSRHTATVFTTEHHKSDLTHLRMPFDMILVIYGFLLEICLHRVQLPYWMTLLWMTLLCLCLQAFSFFLSGSRSRGTFPATLALKVRTEFAVTSFMRGFALRRALKAQLIFLPS